MNKGLIYMILAVILWTLMNFHHEAWGSPLMALLGYTCGKLYIQEAKQMSIKKLDLFCKKHNRKINIKNGKLNGLTKEE